MRVAILALLLFTTAGVRAGLPPDFLWPCAGPMIDPATTSASWIGHTGDLSYQVQFAVDPAFNVIQHDGTTMWPVQSLSMLWYSSIYYWHVRAWNGTLWSSWSYTCSFSTITIPPPPAPQLGAPACETTDVVTSQMLSWNYAIGAINWELQLATNAAFTGAASYFTTNQSYTVSGLLVSQTYHWRVRGASLGGWGLWSSACNFHTRSVTTPLNLDLFLQGPLDPGTLLMSDALRSASLIPVAEPFTALGFASIATPSVTLSAPLLLVAGNDAIVDWVLVGSRHGTTNALLKAWPMLVQRDGDVVMPDGSAPMLVHPMANVKIDVRHRNHLGSMTATNSNMNGPMVSIDFTQTSTALYGTDPTGTVSARRALWSGDANGDGVLKYTGANNDRDIILTRIGGVLPTATVSGYFREDVNLDGTVKYTGAANDRDPILVNIGGVVPTATRTAQLP